MKRIATHERGIEINYKIYIIMSFFLFAQPGQAESSLNCQIPGDKELYLEIRNDGIKKTKERKNRFNFLQKLLAQVSDMSPSEVFDFRIKTLQSHDIIKLENQLFRVQYYPSNKPGDCSKIMAQYHIISPIIEKQWNLVFSAYDAEIKRYMSVSNNL